MHCCQHSRSNGIHDVEGLRYRDLVCLVLSSIPKLTDCNTLFYDCVEKIDGLKSIHDAAYTCILTDYSFYKKPKEALAWLERMKRDGLPVK